MTHIHKDAPFLFSHATLKSMLEALLQGFTELSQRKALSQVAPANKHSAVFRQFVRLVQENHARQHQVQFYAAEMGMKSTTLCHIIKKESGGQTAMEIINSILILAARTLLRTTPTPVKDIALNLGFNNAAFFNKFFKKQVGMTPQKFRNAEK
ncbi:AraC family transcriptional regulator [Bacteroides fragilis]|nr:AraC family transcriptional regulator [Bacteroides fragilis]MCY6335803.1 AraC family transcriptional regulator [Bacteroides fragilis]